MIKFSHLEENKESYFKHMYHALYISFNLFSSSIKCFIHAVYPDVFIDSASATCLKITNYMESRKKSTS